MADLISMLAACAGGGEKDPDFNQTVLLLHGDGTNGAQNNTFLDSSTNNFTITRNGNTTQGTFSPFSLSDGYWSNYFDGTDDYLSVADNAVLRPGAGAFTLEAWIYRNASGAAHTVYAKGGASTGIVFQVTSGNVLRFTHTTTNIDSTGTVAANAWVHVAVVREGTGTNQTKLYINGVQDGQGTVSTDFTQTEEVRIGTNRGATEDFAGYISNVRFVKGSALYTAGFTPSTVPLTTTSQGASSSEVELLTCQSNRFVDNSTNAFAITRNGDVRVTPFSPFAPSAAYSSSVNGGSGYFDGSGDRLESTLTAQSPGTGDFTYQLWVYRSNTNSACLFDTRNVNNNTTGFTCLINGSSQLALYTNGTILTGSGTVPVGAWSFVSVSRSGTTVTLSLNGVSQGTVTFSNNLTDTNLRLGMYIDNTGPFTGYIAGFNYIRGTAASAAIPSAPPSVVSGTAFLCNFTNAGIFDNTGKNNLETVGNAQIDTTTKKYGTGSLEFDGTGDYLVSPASPEINFGTGDFTVEFWLYASSPSAEQRLVQNTNGDFTSTAWIIRLSNSAKIQVALAYPDVLLDSTTTISSNTWYYIALTRLGSSVKLWINGTNEASGTSSGNLTQDRFYIGGFRSATNSEYFTGYIDDLRITKGVARYTANFTPPTAAFPNE